MSGSRKSVAAPERSSAYSLTLAIGPRLYRLDLRRPVFATALLLLPLVGIVYLAATAYWIFHDDLLASLMRREVDMQYAYEDRIGLLRHEIETVKLRARSEEARFGSELQNLTQRQSQAEHRTALLLALSERLKAAHPLAPAEPEGKEGKPRSATETNPLLGDALVPALPRETSAYAPLVPPLPVAPPAARPEPLDLRPGEDTQSRNEAPRQAAGAALALPAPSQAIGGLADGYARLEADHHRVLANFMVPALRVERDIRAALATAGLGVDQSAAGALPRHGTGRQAAGVGGPFVPLSATELGSGFARDAVLVETAIEASDSLRGLLPQIPLRRPLYGAMEVTSVFGPRIDPFLGRAAMHTGIDLLDDYGAAVHATAKGVVTFVGPNGGYGNMVEIDHGNGLTTRYAHLSAINVTLDQSVDAGAILGRIGATGRATGPHLHYETRIAGEPVDPAGFLRAGDRLFGQIGDVFECRGSCPGQEATAVE